MEILSTIVNWIPKSIKRSYKYKGDFMSSKMSPSRPYLIKAMLKWILDNNMTPLLIVDVNEDSVEAPLEYFDCSSDVIFDISEQACYDLLLNDTLVSFYAQFGEDAIDHRINLPMKAVIGIYAEESGKGMRFNDSNEYEGFEDIKAETKSKKLPPYMEVIK